MSRKDTIEALFIKKPLGAPNSVSEPATVRVGAVAAMGSSLQRWSDDAKQAAKLQEQMLHAGSVVELETTLIDKSFVADRITVSADPAFEALVASMRESSQQVPILVRPHPAQQGRFQVAYGHRRLAAAIQLGVPVRTIIRAMNDAELVVAQGKENLERQDLSFIEKALFAKRLEESGFDRATVVSALGVDKADTSRYVSIARAVPEDIILMIGPAPKVGRARWSALVDLLHQGKADRIRALKDDAGFAAAGSDQKFALALAALSQPVPTLSSEAIAARNGLCIGQSKRAGQKLLLTIDETKTPRFADFLLSQLPSLYETFLAKAAESSTSS